MAGGQQENGKYFCFIHRNGTTQRHGELGLFVIIKLCTKLDLSLSNWC